MHAAEVEHVLGFLDAADEGARECAAPEHKGAGVDRLGQGPHVADEHERAVETQGRQIPRDRVVVGHRVDDQVEAAAGGSHLSRIGGEDHVVCAQASRVALLAGRTREERDFRAQALGQLQGHVTQAAQAHHADLGARPDLPPPQR